MSLVKLTLYTARGCSLCERALEVVAEAREELGFELDVISIDGDEILEAAYREHVPVVEIDGQRAFTYFVEPQALRERIARRFSG